MRDDFPNAFVDFDGTIVDNKLRMYRFCCDYSHEGFQELVSIDDYWTLKRYGLDELAVLSSIMKIDYDPGRYAELKLEHMEDEHYLEMDSLIEGAEDALSEISRFYNVILVSRREHPDRLARELSRLGLSNSFDETIVVPHDGRSKASVIRAEFHVGEDDLVIGDTEDDISAGCELGIRTVFVLSGIRSSAYALRYSNKANVAVSASLSSFVKEGLPPSKLPAFVGQS